MKRIILCAGVLAVVLTFSVAAFSQEAEISISPQKHALIAELITVTKAEQSVKDIIETTFRQMDETYPELCADLINSRNDLTPAMRKQLLESVLNSQSREKSLRHRLVSSLDYNDYVEKSFYPLYGKYFSESEISDLITFYRSPTGQRTLEVLPQLFADSIKMAKNILLPKIIELTNTAVREDIAAVEKTLPRKRQRN